MHLIFKIFIFSLLVVLSLSSCNIVYCTQCQFTVATKSIKQTCTKCTSGYGLNSQGTGCSLRWGIVIALLIGGGAAAGGLIFLFISLTIYFKKINKQKSEYTLDQIMQFLADHNDRPQEKQKNVDLHIKYNNGFHLCFKCSLQKSKNKKIQKNIDEIGDKPLQNDQIKLQIQDQMLPDCKLSCNHYYHLDCLKIHLQKNPDSCLCNQPIVPPFELLCIDCRIKSRQLNIDNKNDGISSQPVYICASCKKKRQAQIDNQKWYKKCC